MAGCYDELFKVMKIKYGVIWSDAAGLSTNVTNNTFYQLDEEEFVSSISIESDVKHGVGIFDMKIVTNKRTIGPCGPFPGYGRPIKEHSGSRLLFIAGYSGHWIDTLVFHWN